MSMKSRIFKSGTTKGIVGGLVGTAVLATGLGHALAQSDQDTSQLTIPAAVTASVLDIAGRLQPGQAVALPDQAIAMLDKAEGARLIHDLRQHCDDIEVETPGASANAGVRDAAGGGATEADAFACGLGQDGRGGRGATRGMPSRNLKSRLCSGRGGSNINAPIYADGLAGQAASAVAEIVDNGIDGDDDAGTETQQEVRKVAKAVGEAAANTGPYAAPIVVVASAIATDDGPIADAGRTVLGAPIIGYGVLLAEGVDSLVNAVRWPIIGAMWGNYFESEGTPGLWSPVVGADGARGMNDDAAWNTFCKESPWDHPTVSDDPNALLDEDADPTNCDDPVTDPASKTGTIDGPDSGPTGGHDVEIQQLDCSARRQQRDYSDARSIFSDAEKDACPAGTTPGDDGCRGDDQPHQGFRRPGGAAGGGADKVPCDPRICNPGL